MCPNEFLMMMCSTAFEEADEQAEARGEEVERGLGLGLGLGGRMQWCMTMMQRWALGRGNGGKIRLLRGRRFPNYRLR
jgi:hypothetical protein